MSQNTREQLTLGTVATHWLLAFAMIAMIAFGLYLEQMFEAKPAGVDFTPDQVALIGLHKSLGLVVLALALARIVQRLVNPFPTYVGSYATWEVVLAKLTMVVLVLGTIMMPISGIVLSLGAGKPIGLFGLMLVGPGEPNPMLQQIGQTGHGLGGKLLIAFIVLHVAGALKHRFVDGDGTLHRMAGRKVEVSEQA